MMDNELLWGRISQSVSAIASARKLDMPADLQSASGKEWERNLKRAKALEEFCGDARISLETPFDLGQAADLLDEIALKTMGATDGHGKRRGFLRRAVPDVEETETEEDE